MCVAQLILIKANDHSYSLSLGLESGLRPDRRLRHLPVLVSSLRKIITGSISTPFLTWSDSPVSEDSSTLRSLLWRMMPSAGSKSPYLTWNHSNLFLAPSFAGKRLDQLCNKNGEQKMLLVFSPFYNANCYHC